jgi:hypothetical protein
MTQTQAREMVTWLIFVQPVPSQISICQVPGRMTQTSESLWSRFKLDTDHERKRRRKYRRQVAIDGNFSADHVRMKYPENDVCLTNGQGYMVEDTRYQKHLAITTEVKQVMGHHDIFVEMLISDVTLDRI